MKECSKSTTTEYIIVYRVVQNIRQLSQTRRHVSATRHLPERVLQIEDPRIRVLPLISSHELGRRVLLTIIP